MAIQTTLLVPSNTLMQRLSCVGYEIDINLAVAGHGICYAFSGGIYNFRAGTGS